MIRRAWSACSARVLLSVALCSMGAQARSQPPALGVQRSLGQCPVREMGEFSALLDHPAQWAGILRQGEVETLGRAVDWRQERVLVHALGTKPSLGYGVSAQRVEAGGASEWPTVMVLLTKPEPGALTASALSRPCLVLTLTRGSWRAVRVANAAGRTLGVARVRPGHPRAVHPLPPLPDTGLVPSHGVPR